MATENMTTNIPNSSSTNFDIGNLLKQQSSLRHQGKLHWLHWSILGLSFVMTFLGWHITSSLLHRYENERFTIEANRIVDRMKERMSHYEQALISGVATLRSHQNILTRAQWKDYARTLDLTNRYPGISGIGLIREVSHSKLESFETAQKLSWPDFKVFPEHDFPFQLPIVYIEPEENNTAVIGLDVAFEENRRSAALLARDLNALQISGPISLVQDDSKTPGFLFYAPFFSDDTSFEGLVYAPLVVKNLVNGILGDQEDKVFFSISDAGTVLFDARDNYDNAIEEASYTQQIEQQFYGRTWHFRIYSAPGFASSYGLTQPAITLICGLTIEAMLLILFLLMARANGRVLKLAESMTNQLAKQARILTAKNNELESFAHIVSHDLKTPLRAIQNLTLFIQEDLQDLQASTAVKSTVADHVTRINEQSERGHSLIKGLLDFSLVGHETDDLEPTDTHKLVEDVGKSLGLAEHQLSIGQGMPTLLTYSVRLTQIFDNLLGNAYKHHPSPDNANIVVTVHAHAQFYRFSVADNGKGIDKKYHERVFKPFTMLQKHVGVESSGIGLSIVKKIVEGMGGEVGIVADTRIGTEFYFDWPFSHQNTTGELRHAA